jgi:hypothetical protein
MRSVVGCVALFVPFTAYAEPVGKALDASSPADAEGTPEAVPPPLLRFRAGGSFVYRRYYDIPMYGGGGEFGVLQDWPGLALGLDFDLWAGRSQAGLGFRNGHFGVRGEGRVGRLRLGGGLVFGLFVLDRATDNGSRSGATIGAFVTVSVDLVRIGDPDQDRAVFLGARLGVDGVGSKDFSPLWGPTVDVGVRF